MLTDHDRETLTMHAAKIVALKTDIEAAARARDVDIRGALKAGASTVEIGGLTGLTRARIYQIRDGRR